MHIIFTRLNVYLIFPGSRVVFILRAAFVYKFNKPFSFIQTIETERYSFRNVLTTLNKVTVLYCIGGILVTNFSGFNFIQSSVQDSAIKEN